MRTILSAVIGAMLALSAVEVTAQAMPREKQVVLAIESDTLAAALDQWAAQSGINIFSQSWDVARQLPAPSLRGTFGARTALERLLAGTPLTYVWLNERAVSIRLRAPLNVGSTTLGPPAWDSCSKTGQPCVHLAYLNEDALSDVRVAQAAPAAGTAPATGDSQAVAPLAEVIVTGTHIHGVPPAGSPVLVFIRSDIEKSGAASVGEFLRKIPQNFSLTDQETVRNNGNSTNSDLNVTKSSAVNLRGLGAGATLTLLDGQRLAPSGLAGGFVDVSLIPLSAVERVEMLTDGASAIYGADAVGGVVNFILRRDFAGGETSVRYGDATQGGGAQFIASQLLGTSWDAGNAMLVYEYLDQDAVDVKQRDFIPPLTGVLPGPFALLPEQRRNSVLASLRQGLTSNLDIFGRGFYSERHSVEDVATFTSLTHAEGDAQTAGGSVGAELDISSTWTVAAVADYSATKQETDSRSTPGLPFRQSIKAVSSGVDLRFGGALFDIQGSFARASFGASARREEFDQATTLPGAPEREVVSAYGELFLPLIAPSSRSWMHRLELSLAGRYDDYDDFGTSGLNPKIGVAWSPTEDFGLRASWSESFRAPLLAQMDTATTLPFRHGVFNLPDPASATGFTPTLMHFVPANPSLEPETSTSFTVGLDITPRSLPDLRASLTYYDVDYEDKIATPPLAGAVFLLYQQAAQLAPFILRNPDPVVVATLYGEGVLNPLNIPAANVGAIYDGRYQNIASMTTSGFELNLSNVFRGAAGVWAPFLTANYITSLDARAASTTPESKLFDKVFTPARLRMRGGLSWSRAAISTTLSANYVNQYDNNLVTPPGDVDSWLTFDWHLQYESAASNTNPLFSGLRLGLAVQNVTDEEPPHVSVPSTLQTFDFGYDATNASAMGRFVSLQVSKRW